MNIFRFIFSFLLFSGSALAEPVCPAVADLPLRYRAKTYRDLEYCRPGNFPLHFDISIPVGAQPAPLLVFLHGGAWMHGGKNGFPAQLDLAAKKGFVAAAINYRLASKDAAGVVKHKFPTQSEDVRCALRFFIRNASRFGIDPNRIGVFGESAGGHLALLSGLKDNGSRAVKSVAVFYPPTDLQRLFYDSPDLSQGMILETVFGPNPTSPAYIDASPVSHIKSDSVPILSVHGTVDQVVPYSQSELLVAKGRAVGAPVTLIRCEGEKHGYTPENRRRAFEQAFRFFARTLNLR